MSPFNILVDLIHFTEGRQMKQINDFYQHLFFPYITVITSYIDFIQINIT